MFFFFFFGVIVQEMGLISDISKFIYFQKQCKIYIYFILKHFMESSNSEIKRKEVILFYSSLKKESGVELLQNYWWWGLLVLGSWLSCRFCNLHIQLQQLVMLFLSPQHTRDLLIGCVSNISCNRVTSLFWFSEQTCNDL